MENDILKETIKILKKDQGIDQFNLKKERKDNDHRCPKR